MKLLRALSVIFALLLATAVFAAVIAVPLWVVAVESRGIYAALLLVGGAVAISRTRGSRNHERADNSRE